MDITDLQPLCTWLQPLRLGSGLVRRANLATSAIRQSMQIAEYELIGVELAGS